MILMKLKHPLLLSLVLSLGYIPAVASTLKPAPLAKHPPIDQVKARVKRGAYDPQATPWPNNIVYYALTNASPDTRTAFLAAAQAISDNTALRFVERTTEPRYLLVANSVLFDACGFAAGTDNGPHFLLLNPTKCYSPEESVGLLLHEVMHALGAEHEHQRDDRVGDVIGGSKQATDIRPNLAKHGLFDADSIMMYPPNIIQLPDGYPARTWPRNSLSEGDIKMLQDRYPASKAQRPLAQATLTNHGIASSINRRIAPLRTHETDSISITYPQGITLSTPTIRLYQADRTLARYSEVKGNAAPLKLTGVQIKPGLQGSTLKIDYQATPSEDAHVIMMVVDSPGTDARGLPTAASTLVEITILANSVLPDLKLGALRSGYAIAGGEKRCLAMTGLDENQHSAINHPEFLGLGQDNAALFTATHILQDPVLPLSMAPCNGEKLGQQWVYDAKSQQITDAEENYYLDLRTPVTPPVAAGRSFALRAHRIISGKAMPARWQLQGQRFIYLPFPSLALSEIGGNGVGLAPMPKSQQIPWQQWSWH